MSGIWRVDRLSSDLYKENLAEFAKRSDQYDKGTEILKDLLMKSSKTNIRWLTVGPGLGNWESSIVKMITTKVPHMSIELVEGYEPNRSSFSALKSLVEEDFIWGRNLDSIKLFNEAVTPDTALSCQHDLIMISHVFYYLETVSGRQDLMRLLQNNLSEGGILLVLHNSEGQDGSDPGHQVKLCAEFWPRIIKEGPRDSGCGTADWSLMAGQLMKEFLEVTNSGIKAKLVNVTYKILVLPEDQTERLESFVKVMSFLLAGDLRKLPQDAMDELIAWVRKNGRETEEGVLLYQHGAVLTFEK